MLITGFIYIPKTDVEKVVFCQASYFLLWDNSRLINYYEDNKIHLNDYFYNQVAEVALFISWLYVKYIASVEIFLKR